MDNEKKQKSSLRRIIFWLVVLIVAMFVFTYALVPLYDVLCRALGINGKTSNVSVVNKTTIDKTRDVKVTFVVTRNASLRWAFRPNQKSVMVHPGQNVHVSYYAKNNSGKTMTVQAVPSVTPGLAAKHLHKTECFCFNQQTLKVGQSVDMPLVFHLDHDLPKNINELTLSYTLFAAKNQPKG